MISGPEHYLDLGRPMCSENGHLTLEENQTFTWIQGKGDQNPDQALEGLSPYAHLLPQLLRPTCVGQMSWDIGRPGAAIQSRDSVRCGGRESRRWMFGPNGIINAN